ncbi:MAG: tRNA adenosine(34) deaminase TadA [Gammaproteobacteria bacterium]
MNDKLWMQRALELARHAEALGEVPVGAVLVSNNECVAEAWNRPIAAHDPSAHAEILALRQAGNKLGNYRLNDTTLYVTLEPCAMCAGAIIHARIAKVVYGAKDPRSGAGGSVFQILDSDKLNHRVQITGSVLEAACTELLQDFFRKKRKLAGI